MVLGSGLLLDVPLAELAARFRYLYLVDMVHLPQVRRLAAAFPGVSLLELDVSGTAAELWALGRRQWPVGRDELDALFARPAALSALESADWVASVNLFSQLPLLPLEAASRLCPAAGETDLLRWQQQILVRHLDWLRQRPACLLADAVQILRRANGGREVMDYSPWLGALGPPGAAWSWLLADEAESGDGSRVEHEVRAWCW